MWPKDHWEMKTKNTGDVEIGNDKRTWEEAINKSGESV